MDYITETHNVVPRTSTRLQTYPRTKLNTDTYIPDLRHRQSLAWEDNYEESRSFKPKSLGRRWDAIRNDEANSLNSSNLFNRLKNNVIETQATLFSPPKLNQRKSSQNPSRSPLLRTVLPIKEKTNLFIQRIEHQNEQLEKAEANVRELTLQNHYLEISNNSLKQKVSARDTSLHQFKNKCDEYELQLTKQRELYDQVKLEAENLRRENKARPPKEVHYIRNDSNADCSNCKQCKIENEERMGQMESENLVLRHEILFLKAEMTRIKMDKDDQITTLQRKLAESEQTASTHSDKTKEKTSSFAIEQQAENSKDWYEYGDSTEELLCGSPDTFNLLRSLRHSEQPGNT